MKQNVCTRNRNQERFEQSSMKAWGVFIGLIGFAALLLGLLPGGSTQASESLGIDNDFNDGLIDFTKWSLVFRREGEEGATVGTILEADQRFVFVLNPSLREVHADAFTACSLDGDFDVQVDYALLDWLPDNKIKLGLMAHDLLFGRTAGSVQRVSEASYGGEVYLAHFLNGIGGVSPTSDLSGKLRLTRTGSTMTAFVFDGDAFAAIHSGLTTANPVRLSLALFTSKPTPGGQVAFDNLSVNSGKLVCPQAE